MGGTRCIFRDCQVSTQRNPKMHFFKFPVRDPLRLEKWLRNCGNAEILNVAREKLNNRAVCARHFRYECFMNYKLDRLIPNQTPTLMRVSKDLAWDLENLDENGEATMVKLSPPTKSHLIPPHNFECPLGFNEDARFGRKYAPRIRTPPMPLILEPSKRQKIVHDHNNITEAAVNFTSGNEKIQISKTEATVMANFQTNKTEASVNSVTEIGNFQTNKTEASVNSTAESQLQQEQNGKPIDVDTTLESRTVEGPTVVLTPPVLMKSEDSQLKYEQLMTNYDELSKENAELKQSMVKLVAECQAQARVMKTNSSSAFSAPQLSKAQLYNSIKKYLGPTMAALVRMEMFGAAERSWKSDEREFAKELLQLGEHVYTHCCDEWRFRLPSLRMARRWLDEADNGEVEDDLL